MRCAGFLSYATLRGGISCHSIFSRNCILSQFNDIHTHDTSSRYTGARPKLILHPLQNSIKEASPKGGEEYEREACPRITFSDTRWIFKGGNPSSITQYSRGGLRQGFHRLSFTLYSRGALNRQGFHLLSITLYSHGALDRRKSQRLSCTQYSHGGLNRQEFHRLSFTLYFHGALNRQAFHLSSITRYFRGGLDRQ